MLLWGGGMWNWFDPLTVIKAVAELARSRPHLRLVFLGTRHPNPEIEEMAMTRRALELAAELGLRIASSSSTRAGSRTRTWRVADGRRRRRVSSLRRRRDALLVPHPPAGLRVGGPPHGVDTRATTWASRSLARAVGMSSRSRTSMHGCALSHSWLTTSKLARRPGAQWSRFERRSRGPRGRTPRRAAGTAGTPAAGRSVDALARRAGARGARPDVARAARHLEACSGTVRGAHEQGRSPSRLA